MARYWFAVLVLALGGVAWSQTTVPATLPTTGPATTLPADASTPKGALRMLFLATDAGDQATIRSLLYTTSPLEEKMANTMAEMSAAAAELQKAIKAAFGEEQTKAVLGDSATASKMRDELLTKLVETVSGDTAVIKLDGLGQFTPVEFKNVQGTWKLRIGKSLENQDPSAVKQQLDVVALQTKVYHDIAADVQAGKEKSVEDVKQNIQARVRQAMMQYVQDQQKATTAPATAPTTKP